MLARERREQRDRGPVTGVEDEVALGAVDRCSHDEQLVRQPPKDRNVAQEADVLEIAKPVRERAKRYARDIRRRERAIWNL